MKTRFTSATWFVLSATVLAASLALGSCYNPDIPDGSLFCGPEGECPSGFDCHRPTNRCFKSGTEPGSAGAGGTAGAAGTGVAGSGGGGMAGMTMTGGMGGAGGMMAGGAGGMMTGGMGGAPACFSQMYPMCPSDPGAGRCDAVCQTGCGCRERCTYEGSTPVCRAFSVTPTPLYAECNPRNDTCTPGSICLEEIADACRAHCYRMCRTDAECGGRARCTGEVAGADYKTCSPPIEACNPIGPGARTCQSRGAPFGCYVLSARYADQAVCDCAGNRPEGATCSFEHECVPGNECVRIGDRALCRRLCNLANPTEVACPAGQTCTPFVSDGQRSNRVGYCRPAL
jgi:hypothetical protein